ncbi:hypothetical protein DPMN_105450, partial [Dreissena polymorpha]
SKHLTKFHEDWTINVASRELTWQMLTPHNARRTKGDHKSSPSACCAQSHFMPNLHVTLSKCLS